MPGEPTFEPVASGETQIDWRSFQNNDEIGTKLKGLAHDAEILIERDMSPDEANRVVQSFIAEKGYPYSVSVSVSEPNGAGQRMIMGMTYSPLNGETISF